MSSIQKAASRGTCTAEIKRDHEQECAGNPASNQTSSQLH